MPRLDGRPLTWLLLFTAGMAFLLFGYDMGVCGGVTELHAFRANFAYPDATMLGFMVASYNVGCLVGAGLAFSLGDWLGRKRSIIFGCVVVSIGAVLQCSAFSQAQWIVGRIIAGIGTGSISSTVPVWVSECSKPHRRGVLVILEVTIVIGGIALSNWSNYGFIYRSPWLNGTDTQWRVPIAGQLVFPLFVFATIGMCPESPRWLAQVGRYDEVAPLLARLHGKDVSVDEPEVKALTHSIIQTAKHEAAIGETNWRECFEMGELQNFRRLVLCGLAGFFQQATGIQVVVYYAPAVFANVGMNPEMSFIMAGGAQLAFLIGSALPTLYIERLGRRRAMMMCSAMTGTCMLAVAVCVALGGKHPEWKVSTGWAATVFIFIYELTFGMGWNSMSWLYGSEVASFRLRNKGSSTQNLCNWATAIVAVMTTPIGLQNIGWRFYLVWAIVTLAGIPVVYCCFPETSGRSLEQMDLFFAKYRHWRINNAAHEWIEHQSDGIPSAPTPYSKDSFSHVEEKITSV